MDEIYLSDKVSVSVPGFPTTYLEGYLKLAITNNASPPDGAERANQLYRAYLNCAFDEEYYRGRHKETLSYSNNFDMSIGLGAALSGGSGLGILADPAFAWVCGIITSGSVIASVAKASYKIDTRAQAAMDRVVFYGGLRAKLYDLIQDVQASCAWSPSFEGRFLDLREKISNFAPYPFSHWDADKLRGVQEIIKARTDYESWWNFRR